MAGSDDERYVRTQEIPEWMAQALRVIVPAAFVALVGSGFMLWRTVAVLSYRTERITAEFQEFRKPGGRYTAEQGKRAVDRLDALETWRQQHLREYSEIAGKHQSQLRECLRRLERLEDEK